MKSPFPGMDPYLEAHWLDVHARLIYLSCTAINHQLEKSLRARIGERLVVEQDTGPVRSIYPDIRVFEMPEPAGAGEVEMTSAVAVAEPLIVRPKNEPVRQGCVQIIDVSSGGRVVTIIEFLSPSNKLAGDGREQYRKKQQEARDADINLVEIDLTRGGEREFLYPLANVPAEYRTTYGICVRRGFGKVQFDIYRAPLAERLPKIRIPLRPHDKDVVLDLQHLIDQAWRDGRYDDIDYRKPCIPPLAGEELAWAEGLLKLGK